MPNRLDWKIVLAGASMLISVVPALAHGGGSAGHSSLSRSSSSAVGRVGGPARSVGQTSTRLSSGVRFTADPAARMLVTTTPSVPTLTTTSRTTSAVADPSATTAASASTTSSASGMALAALAELGQANPGVQDLAAPAVVNPMTTVTATATPITSGAQILEAQILGANVLLLPTGQVLSLSAPPALSTPMTTDITSVTPAATGPQLLGVNGLILTNAATSGAVPQAPTTAAISSVAIIGTQGEVIATTGGSSVTGGATGRNIPECMEAWDKATHITKTKWRGVCARTLTEEHMY